MESMDMEVEVLSDEDVARVRAVYESDHTRLWRSLYAFSGSRDIADEAAAEAFAQVLRRGADVRDVAAWVWRSAYAIARGLLNQRPTEFALVGERAVDDVHADLRPLLQKLGELSDRDRELLVLCHVGGWQPKDLAPVLGVRAGALRVRLHRATKRARELLEGEVER